MLSFNLSSEALKATTSPELFIKLPLIVPATSKATLGVFPMPTSPEPEIKT